ncbi:aldo/keto reductase family protein [Pseudarthrobacter raffinosi]|uniref:aldo/keto reductase family protein n=1 Tax=Pseudarthrobacter raffinosi TaxID=2953651 RepID=UPI00208EB07E|nr:MULTISPECIES: aldo/keto reductase family protein [unclassified Pseudarthrobacter]MCO4236954.1 aldo/keto reductase family protein [Pseudarthrobacter sp. MDT3-28]MCO4250674.1 aldo/keto reductase family protein [Pseudarthrobacter sp. MDT3-9]MCO4261561.1 aldo/keto reductase family protein [Pseudarthrobacter sp. MDT3-26]
MQYRKLGNSGMYVSSIALGNWATHGETVDQDVATACVRKALDLGITTFDTADAYAGTKAETMLGEALKGVRREGIEVMTKAFFPTGTGKNDRGLSRKHVMESINGSLRRLQTDYVDVYQAHRYDYETPLEETMGAFADIVRAGKAHYIGVSEWTVAEIRAGAALAGELGIQFVSSQPQYNMLWRVIEPEVVPVCEELGITQVCWSPLAQGVLSGKYGASTVPAGSRFTADDGGLKTEHKFMQPEVLERVEKLKPIAADLGVPLATLAVAWVLANPNVSAAIVGASRSEQLDDTVKAADLPLGQDTLDRIDGVLGDVVERDPAKVESFPTRV